MSAAFSYIVGGVECSLSDNTLGQLVEAEGIEIPTWLRFEEQGPQQPGSTDRGSLLSARLVRLVVRLYGPDATRETLRRTLRRLFAPTSTGTLKRTTASGAVRRLNVVSQGMNRLVRSAVHEEYEVQLKAGDPAWYVLPALTTTLLAAPSNELAIPLVIPLQIGSSVLTQDTTIQYAGEIDEFPILTITGPADTLVIPNVTAGTSLVFDKRIEPGETLTVDCRYGHKTITNQAGTNRISLLARGQHDLATFRLVHDMESLLDLNYTENEFGGVVATGADNRTTVTITYYTRELGV